MNAHRNFLTRTSAAIVLALLFAVSSKAIDRNNNRESDIWELVFQAQTLLPAEDSDHDGMTNREESEAGTNPLDATSLAILTVRVSPETGPAVCWNTQAGKRYTLLMSQNLASSWTTNSVVLGTGEPCAVTTIPTIVSPTFFRLIVDDVDTDQDGVADWEEIAVGFNPRRTHTDRYPETDLARITALLTASNIVTVSALDPSCYERWLDPGLIAVRRSGGLQPLTVRFSLTGTAVQGVDYQTSQTNSIVLGPGVREGWIQIHPIADNDDAEADETIILTLLPAAGYRVGSNSAATVTLVNETTRSLPNPKSAARFLIQAAFGPDADDAADSDIIPENVEDVVNRGFAGWIEDQFNRPIGYLEPWVHYSTNLTGYYLDPKLTAWWNRAMGVSKLRPDDAQTVAPDPLRQRVAFALSQILVVSDRQETLAVNFAGVANYYDVLLKNAFGNYRDLLLEVSLHPVMGFYLSHLLNRKADPAKNLFPDENYAREIMQLFSIGLWELNLDGTRRLDALGRPIPTYDNSTITEMARVFTGLGYAGNATFTDYPQNFLAPMRLWDSFHDLGPKRLLQGITLPARTASSPDSGAAARADITEAVTMLVNHPNTGPFIGRQLIQRFVTSNPSTGYVARVAAAFADNGSGIRGDLRAVIRAVLLDSEARDPVHMSDPAFGKLREPFLRCVNLARAFNAKAEVDYYALSSFELDHIEEPFKSQSVFNFYSPNYAPAGPLRDTGLVAPEFQILNAGTAITGPNYFLGAILGELHRWGSGVPANVVRLNLSQELALTVPSAHVADDDPNIAGLDPDPLLRRLDLVLTCGTLRPEMFQIIREAMLRLNYPTWQWHRERVQIAIYLILTSADFNVVR